MFDTFFSENEKVRNKTVYDWGQTELLGLNGKTLERKVSTLLDIFLSHPEAQLVDNLIIPEIYWAGAKTVNHRCLNYGLKELLMNLLVYGKCDYIHIEKTTNKIHIDWNFDSKSARFIYKDIRDKKENKTLKSGFTQEQKDIIWSALSIGYLDVEVKSKKQAQIHAETEINNDSLTAKLPLNDKKKRSEKTVLKNEKAQLVQPKKTLGLDEPNIVKSKKRQTK